MSERKDCVNCPYWDDDYGCQSDTYENCVWTNDEEREGDV